MLREPLVPAHGEADAKTTGEDANDGTGVARGEIELLTVTGTIWDVSLAVGSETWGGEGKGG